MSCPKCGQHKWHKAGFRWSGSHKVQSWRCSNCGTITTRPELVGIAPVKKGSKGD